MSAQVSPGACPGESDIHNLTFLFLWTKIEFNKEKRHLIGDHIFAEERCPGVYKCAIMDDDNEEGEN